MDPDGRTDGRTEWTDGRTDGRTHGQRQNYIPPTSSGDNKRDISNNNSQFSNREESTCRLTSFAARK